MADAQVIEAAPAKINLDLLVTNRRSDGYHELDSLVVFTDLGDEIRIGPADGLELELTGPFADRVPADGDNIVMRAAQLLAGKFTNLSGARLTLDKRLPVAAGIGGGSSDAGAVLRGLNRFWRLGLSVADLVTLGIEVGADVPVCTYAAPARIRGIGERIDPLRGLPDLPMVLVNPRVEVLTGAVFARLEVPLDAVSRSPFRANPSIVGFATWLAQTSNELQPSALELAPEISEVLGRLASFEEVLLARMSGSGATCFALLSDERAAIRLADQLAGDRSNWWVANTIARGQP